MTGSPQAFALFLGTWLVVVVLVAAAGIFGLRLRKPLRCLLGLHRWRRHWRYSWTTKRAMFFQVWPIYWDSKFTTNWFTTDTESCARCGKRRSR